MRTKTLLNENWLFVLNDNADPASISSPGTEWKQLDLPHDWDTEHEPDEHALSGGGGGYERGGIGWYKKTLFISAEDLAGQITLVFDGVYMDSTVYINGKAAGGHGYGYSSFTVNCNNYMCPGENEIAVCVDNSRQPNCRWYSGSGIYRNVWLLKTGNVHVDIWGVRCDTNGVYATQNLAALQIKAAIKNDTDKPVHTGIKHRVFDAQGKEVSLSGTALYLAPGQVSECTVRPMLEAPHLWTDKDPYLYTLVSQVVDDAGNVIDEVSSRIGIRTAVFDTDKGFLLNGETVKIKGMCLHHDGGLTGAAFYKETWKRRLEALRDMGCNGIRCAHNPPAPELLDLCDEMGFLVMDEIFDEWLLTKNKIDNYYSEKFAYGSSQYFAEHAEEDLVTMLRRDYNHPSVIIWSIGNEIPEQSSLDGVKILNFLQDICHREDSGRMVTSACDNIVAPESFCTLREFENALDVVGYNYVGRWRERAETFYEEDRIAYPGRRFIGTENPSAGGVRGVYECGSGFRNYVTATMHHESLWRYMASHDFVSGDYLWTGIDYLGETRWPSRGAACGPLDSASFKKDTFYYFRSLWNTEEITLHLLPHWNWKGEEGQFKTVICYTNCDKVALYINDKLVAERGFSCPRYGCTKAWNDSWSRYQPTTNDLHLTWDVPFEAGELKAVGYKDDKIVAIERIVTTGEAVSITASADCTVISPLGLAQIELTALDAEGREVPTAGNAVKVTIEGPGRLIGMDGGDMMDLSLYGNDCRKLFAGKLLAVIQAIPGASGEIKATFSAEGMADVSVTVAVK